MIYEDRPYQSKLVEDARLAIRNGARRPLIVLPTGGGKTKVACDIILGAVAKGKRILFLAHRRELIFQPSGKLDDLGVDHGIVMAQHWRSKPELPVQVASIQTLVNRQLAHEPDLIFIDEAHRTRAKTYIDIIERHHAAVVIGLTATPIRSDGKGLGNIFDVLVHGPSVTQLTAGGYLVPWRGFAPGKPNLAGVKKTGGDYSQAGLQRAMDRPTITGDILAHWRRHAENRLTFGFACGIEHSIQLRDTFLAAGIPAAHVDAETDSQERADLFQALRESRIRVLWNVGIATEGIDIPPVSCAILARPTCSTGLFLQMCGRILRPYPGKVDALILDHAGCTRQHGYIDDDRQWCLDVDAPFRTVLRPDTALDIKVCPRCDAVASRAAMVCDECGYEFAGSKRRGVAQTDGELEEIKKRDYSRVSQDRRREMYAKWQQEQRERRYKPMYARAKYRAMFGVWPS